MKAFKVHYDTPSKSDRMIVLAEEESDVELAVSNKDKSYRIGNRYQNVYKVNLIEEIPLSNVMVSVLSVTELFELQRYMVNREETEKPVQMEWEDFAVIMDRTSKLSENDWSFQFLNSSIIVYKGEDIFCYCDNIQEFYDFMIEVER